MRARQNFVARFLNKVHATRTQQQNKVKRQRRFEGLETRQVLSANGLCADLEGDPDRPIEAEVAKPLTNECSDTKCIEQIVGESANDQPAIPTGNEAGVWDDTDIVHVLEGLGHDAALEHFDFSDVLADVSPELLEAVANVDFQAAGTSANGFFDVFVELSSENDFFDIWTELQSGEQKQGFDEIEVAIGDQSNGAIFVKIPGLTAESIIDVGDLPDGLTNNYEEVKVTIGDQSNGAIFVKIPGLTADSIIDVGDLPDGLTNNYEVVKVTIGDQSNGAIFVKIPGLTADSIIDVGDLPDGLTNNYEEVKVTIGDQSNGAIFVKIPGLTS